MQAALKHLEGAYNTFFRKQSAFPRFKLRNDKQSFKVPQFTRVENNRIYIPKFSEGIEINLHRKMEGKILFATISKTATHKYFASITCQVEHTPQVGVQKRVGVDLGIKSLLVDSTGKDYPNIKTTVKNCLIASCPKESKRDCNPQQTKIKSCPYSRKNH